MGKKKREEDLKFHDTLGRRDGKKVRSMIGILDFGAQIFEQNYIN